ncbi:carbohydrate ABC transporter permease [Methylobrevis albus]|uniref:Sugar ABC transporter permease n=1 Tax=Methylobrevis albus TaxID=2793297 RepID=A0A931MZH8_9HYPH|nr:sugar ABC transporter permease [Methylobrevis albus]MBH0238089.1 sugar ABC transporter permease [Methylobrevis albus]
MTATVPLPATPAAKGGGRAVRTLPFIAPSVAVLLVWMIVPLAMTLWFSFQRYNLLNPFLTGFAGVENYQYLFEDPALWSALANTLLLVGWVLVSTVVLGTLFAVLFDQDFFGRGVARLFVIAPFFVMPTVSALIWKNLLMHPVNGFFAYVSRSLGLPVIDWFTNIPLTAIIVMVAWQWVPFATLILLTAIQSLDRDQMEAARMDGAKSIALFRYIIVPHLMRPIAIVVMIETLFLLSIFAEILVTTSGGPGVATTNLTYLIYVRALLEFDVGGASAGGVVAIILANIIAFFLIRTIARNLTA